MSTGGRQITIYQDHLSSEQHLWCVVSFSLSCADLVKQIDAGCSSEVTRELLEAGRALGVTVARLGFQSLKS